MSGLGSLHKVLKDETRRRIILILNEKGSLTYTELLDSLEVVSTGLLNYHLKVLSELVTKNSNGHYILTEKGELASKLLLEFPQESTLLKLRKWERKFWKAAVAILFSFSIINVAAYFLGYLSLNSLYLSLIFAIPGICAIYVFEHFMRDVISEKLRKKYLIINYYSRGIVLGFLIWWGIIIVLVLTGFSRQLSALGQAQILLALVLLLICIWVGTDLNKRQMKKPDAESSD
jgi:DNA-binding transcriptional ArsR family regulator